MIFLVNVFFSVQVKIVYVILSSPHRKHNKLPTVCQSLKLMKYNYLSSEIVSTNVVYIIFFNCFHFLIYAYTYIIDSLTEEKHKK